MSEKKKDPFFAKLTKILLIILALLTVSVIVLPYIWKYNQTYDDSPSPKPQEQPAQDHMPKKTSSKKRGMSTKLIKQKREKIESKESDTDLKNAIPSLDEEFVSYIVEPEEATSAHLTQKLSDILTGGPQYTERIVIITAYLKRGVNPNQVSDDNSPVFLAARSWDLLLLKQLGTIDFAASTTDGWTIMHIICQKDPSTEYEKKRAAETLLYLIENGGDIDVMNIENGYSPLMYAIKRKNSEIVEILLAFGANACGPIIHDFDKNPLMLAMQTRDMISIKLLLHYGAKYLSYNRNGISAVHEAVIQDYVAGVSLFIELSERDRNFNAKNIQVPEPSSEETSTEERETGATLLHFAVMYNRLAVAQHLILHFKVDLTLTDKKGYTAFEHANYCYQHYSEAAMLDPENNAEDRDIAEKILKLFSSGEDERQNYIKQLEDDFDRNLYELNRRHRVAEERAEIERRIAALGNIV